MAKGSSSEATSGATDIMALFVQAARPQLFRENAFRVAELPVDASPRDLANRQQVVEITAKTGIPVPPGPCRTLPVKRAGNPDAVREAITRLREPERRLMDEFFWLWPLQPGQGKGDPALQSLGRGDTKTAIGLWRSHEGAGDGSVATHNLAVMSHAWALDMELLGQTRDLAEQERKQCNVYWLEAFKRWRLLLARDGVWTRLTDRIRELDDPRLTPDTSRQLRSSLPLVLLLVNAQLAINAAERRKTADAKRHAWIMQNSGFDRDAIDEALRRGTEAIRDRIKMLCKVTEQEKDREPEHADQAMRRLLDKTLPLLAMLDCVFPPNHALCDAAHDEVALCALLCQVAYGNKTEDWATSLQLLETALTVATGDLARGRIQENLDIVRTNREFGTCYFCKVRPSVDPAAIEVKMYGDVTRTPTWNGVQINWRYTSIKIPRCAECKAAHSKSENYGCGGAAIGVLFSILGIACFGAGVPGWIFGGILAGIGIWLGIKLARVGKLPSDIQPQATHLNHPKIQDLKKQGWAFGEKPNTS